MLLGSIPLMETFVINYAEEIFDMKSKIRIKFREEIPELKDVAPTQKAPTEICVKALRHQVLKNIIDYIGRAKSTYDEFNETLKELDKANHQALMARGQIDLEAEGKFNSHLAKCRKLHNCLIVFRDFLNFNKVELSTNPILNNQDDISAGKDEKKEFDEEMYAKDAEKYRLYWKLPVNLSENNENSKTKETPKEESEGQKSTSEQVFSGICEQISLCNSIEQADAIALKFLGLSNKKWKKELCHQLLDFRRDYYFTMPYHCRIAAVVAKHHKNFQELINERLKADFDLFRAPKVSDHISKEKRIRNIRYCGEMVKFRVFSPHFFLNLLKQCIDDFTLASIETLCAGLESCGDMLYEFKDTNQRLMFLIEKCQNQMKLRPLPHSIEAATQNAILLCKSSERKTRKLKEKSELEQFLAFLLLEKIESTRHTEMEDVLISLLDSESHVTIIKGIYHVVKHGTFEQVKQNKDDSKPKLLLPFFNLSNLPLVFKERLFPFEQMKKLADVLDFVVEVRPDFRVELLDFLSEKIIDGVIENKQEKRKTRISEVWFFGLLFYYYVIDKSSLPFQLFMGSAMSFEGRKPFPFGDGESKGLSQF